MYKVYDQWNIWLLINIDVFYAIVTLFLIFDLTFNFKSYEKKYHESKKYQIHITEFYIGEVKNLYFEFSIL